MTRDREVKRPEGWFIKLKGAGERGPFKTRDDARAASRAHRASLKTEEESEYRGADAD